MLKGYRLLDLTDEKGMLCGRIIAELGADVIKLEPPAGDPSRRNGPLTADSPGRKESLYWSAFNLGKKGITLNLETEEGKGLLRKLVEKSDFLVESFPAGYMDGLGLGYASLRRINPGLIMTSITLYGQLGPRSSYRSTDLVAMALGGLTFITGDADRPPVKMGFPLAYSAAGVNAVAASLLAHHSRNHTGAGQHIDVSIVECVSWLTLTVRPFWEMEKRLISRAGPFRGGRGPGILLRMVWPCKDGELIFMLQGGLPAIKQNLALREWLQDEGLADDFILTFDGELDLWRTPKETYQHLEDLLGQLFMRHTKAELYREAIERGVMLTPSNTIGEAATSEQLEFRKFWAEVPGDNSGARYPKRFFTSTLNAHPGLRPAPSKGEHNSSVYAELGLSPGDLAALRNKGVI